MALRFGFVENILLAFTELGIVDRDLAGKIEDDPAVRAENRFVKLFLDGNSRSKSSKISRARKNMTEFYKTDVRNKKSEFVREFRYMNERTKNDLLREAYLHIYLRLCQAIEEEALGVLNSFIETNLGKKKLFNFETKFDKEANAMWMETLYYNLRFARQLTKKLREKLELPEHGWTIYSVGSAFNDLEPARVIQRKKYYSKYMGSMKTTLSTISDKLDKQLETNDGE